MHVHNDCAHFWARSDQSILPAESHHNVHRTDESDDRASRYRPVAGMEGALDVAAARSGAAAGVQRPYRRSWMRVGPAQWQGLIVWGGSVAPPSLLVRAATRAGRCDSL